MITAYPANSTGGASRNGESVAAAEWLQAASFISGAIVLRRNA